MRADWFVTDTAITVSLADIATAGINIRGVDFVGNTSEARFFMGSQCDSCAPVNSHHHGHSDKALIFLFCFAGGVATTLALSCLGYIQHRKAEQESRKRASRETYQVIDPPPEQPREPPHFGSL